MSVVNKILQEWSLRSPDGLASGHTSEHNIAVLHQILIENEIDINDVNEVLGTILAKEFLIEKALDSKSLFDFRHLSWRPQKFIDKLKAGSPFVDKENNEYYPETGEAERLSPIIKKTVRDLQKNRMVKIPDIEVKIKGMGPIHTKHFEKADLQKPTGQFTQKVNVQPIGIGIATDPKRFAQSTGKSTITTAQSIQNALDYHKEIPAIKLYDVIETNQPLDEAGELGVAIKRAAREINDGKNPEVHQYDKKIQKTIAIDAGEYLGILSMIADVANFPNKKSFLKFLNTLNLDNLLLIFPGEQNASLADSYGVQNVKTGHTIMISSKGGVGKTASGAAPALSGLRQSIENLEKNIKPGSELDFINLMISTPTVKQGFVGLNWIEKYYPNHVPNFLRGSLPFAEDDINKTVQNIKMRGNTPIPNKFKKFTKEPYMRKSKGTDGGVIVYFTVKTLVKLVNDGLIPNFRETVLELLGENFVQIFTRVVGGKLEFDVLWPGKVDGDVSLYTKLSTADMSQSLSFKVI